MKNKLLKTILIGTLISFVLFSTTILMTYQVLVADQEILDFINKEN